MNRLSLGRARDCKYSCGTLLAWDNEESYFVEVENNNMQHTRERCESLRGTSSSKPAAPTPQPRQEVKQAVNQDLMMAVLQELRGLREDIKRANGYLAKIAGEEQ